MEMPCADAHSEMTDRRHADAGLLTVLRQRPDEPHSLQVYQSLRESGRLIDHDDVEGR